MWSWFKAGFLKFDPALQRLAQTLIISPAWDFLVILKALINLFRCNELNSAGQIWGTRFGVKCVAQASEAFNIPCPCPLDWPDKSLSGISWTAGGSWCTCPASPPARFPSPPTASDRSDHQHTIHKLIRWEGHSQTTHINHFTSGAEPVWLSSSETLLPLQDAS